MDGAGIDRCILLYVDFGVMFGTNAPLVELAVSSEDWVELVRRLPRNAAQ